MDFDPRDLDPGIRATVLWLIDRGFETTDSGDGITKRVVGHPQREEALDFPHVFMRGGEVQADLLFLLLRDQGVDILPGCIDARYDPIDEMRILGLLNVVLIGDDWEVRPLVTEGWRS